MIDRYINDKINAIWNDQNKFDTWKLIQEKYVETLENLKIAESGVAKKIQAAEVLKEEVYKQEEITNHDLASFVDILQEKIGKGSNWVHYGLTSSDIVDTANSLLIIQSIEVTQELILGLLKEIKSKATKEKDTKIIGRTHGVFAEETFLGNIFGNWYLEIKRSLVRVERAKESIAYGKLSGPVGNHTVVTEEMEELTLEKLGLKSEIFASQIVSRDRYAEVFSSLSILASTYERISTNLRSYQRSEISEMYEPFKDGQKGSSAMPHKKNPILSENLTGLARMVRSYVTPALENIALWHERDISHSSVERNIAPDANITLDFALARLANILENMVIYPRNMLNNLNLTKGLIFSQEIMLELAKTGVSREKAYKIVQNLVKTSFNRNLKLIDLIKKDKLISSKISYKQIDKIFSYSKHFKNINYIFKRVFK